MNYSEIIARMPRELWSRMQAEAVYAPWLGQGSGLEEIWADPVVMETVYNRMGLNERTVLEAIVRDIGSELFDAAKLEKSAGVVLSGAEIKAGLAGLLRKGLVFAFRKSWGELVYLLPEDSLVLWQQIMHPGLYPIPSETTALSGIEPIEVIPSDIRRGIFQSLVFAAQEELKLTQNGTLHKKQLQKWLELIPLNQTLLQGLSIKYAYCDAYPVKAAIMLDILLRLQFIVPDGEALRLRPKALKSWLNRSANEQNLKLYGLWKRLTLPAEAWMQHAVIILERAAPGEWISAFGLLIALERQGLLPAAADREKIEQRLYRLQQEWLDPLAAMGWVERGAESVSGKVYYRWRVQLSWPHHVPLELEEAGRFMVQPDFDIIVPPDVADAVCWELCCMADPIAVDQVSVYKLSKASVRRALENGRSAEEMAEFLESHAFYGVPDHIRSAIEEWARPFGRMAFANTLLLRCNDEETAAAVAKLPGAVPYFQEAVGAKDFIIAAGDLKPLAAVLEKAGYMPGMPLIPNAKDGSVRGKSYPKLTDVNGREDEADADLSVMERGLIYARISAHYFQLESRVPEPSDLYPDLKDIPPMWLRDYRSYHVSTRKEMVEKAIELKTLLQVRRNGTDYRVAPRKVQDTRGTWCMTGVGQRGDRLPQGSEVRWLADEWDEMKLILPGINDKY